MNEDVIETSAEVVQEEMVTHTVAVTTDIDLTMVTGETYAKCIKFTVQKVPEMLCNDKEQMDLIAQTSLRDMLNECKFITCNPRDDNEPHAATRVFNAAHIVCYKTSNTTVTILDN